MPNLRQRQRQPEIMDQPDLNPHAHAAALTALVRINWWSGSAGILWPSIHALARATPDRPLRVLDVASGAGDVPLRLWHKARVAGIPLEIDGCDISATACAYAQQQAEAVGAQVRFFALDVLKEPLPAGYDVMTSSLFLHHLNENAAIEVLHRLGQAARQLVLVNDLARSRRGYVLAWLGTRLLSRSWVAHIDGPRSVEGAFTGTEALELARQAGLVGATIARHWPCRFLLTWRRPA